jgi:protein-L-isoaspartate(D-aspartate) O-methyltransferase
VTTGDTLETLAQRARLVERLRHDARISDQRVLAAFARIPRHLFVPPDQLAYAYQDRALPLFENQTVSQPTIVAIMLESLGCQATDRALEVGGGSGYAAALLGCLVEEVHTIEVRPALSARARENLMATGITNVHVHDGDGRCGLPECAPFQRILVSAGASRVPTNLLDQLSMEGRIVIPVDDAGGQTLEIGQRKHDGQMEWTHGVPCIFVPLVEGTENA